MKFINANGWSRPRGYSNGVIAQGRQFYIAGQIGWDENGRIVSPDLSEQAGQALANICAVLKAGGAKPQHVVRMTWYVTDKKEYTSATKSIGEKYQSLFGKHFPAMTLVEVADLLEDGAKIEIEATAVIPSED